jgi:hypothetical protein
MRCAEHIDIKDPCSITVERSASGTVLRVGMRSASRDMETSLVFT